MKDIKKIRELYDLVTEAEEKETRKLTALVRAGLFDAKKLPALKRALHKSADKMTAQERRMLINLLDSLMSEVLGSPQVYSKVKQNVQQHEKLDEAIKGQGYLSKYDPRGEKGYPREENMPAVIVLKRKAIRVYPDNTKVALYYSQALDKYVSIPFGETGVSNMNEQNERASVGADQSVDLPGSKKRKRASDDSSRRNASDETRKNAADILKYNKSYDNKKTFTGRMGHLMNKGGLSPGKAAAVALAKPLLDKFRKKRISGIVNRARARTDIAENTVTENFSSKLQYIRELRQYGKVDAALDAASFLPGPAGTAASLGSAAASLSRGDVTGAALDVAGAIPVVGYGAKAAKVAKVASKTNKVAKVAKAEQKTTKALRPKSTKTTRTKKSSSGKIGAIGDAIGALAAGSGGGGGGSSSSSSEGPKFTKGDYNFSMKPKTSAAGEFDANKALRQRDTQAQRKMMTNESAFDVIRKTVAENLTEAVVSFGDKQITINNSVANKINNLYESMNKQNKKVMENMINESASSFSKVLTFSVRY